MCVVMDNIFYIIGGEHSNKTEYIDINVLLHLNI